MTSKTKTFITTLATAGIFALGTSSAMAAEGVSVADIDKDGTITTEELVSYVQTNFQMKAKGNVLSAREAAELEALFDIDG